MLAILSSQLRIAAPTAPRVILRPSLASASVRNFHAGSIRFSYPTGKNGAPLSPYVRFSKEKWSELLKSEPNMTFAERGRRMGELWRALSQSERDRYKDEYKKEFAKYKGN